LTKTKVLILDDDPVARDIFARVLTAEGYDVRMAGTAKEAMDLADTFKPQALVSDWMLKEELDGLDVARVLRERQPELRIFFITGLPADHLKNQLNGLSICRIYEKPAQFDPLLNDLEAEFGQKRA
jgi:two-component system, OmpR family, response regulator